MQCGAKMLLGIGIDIVHVTRIKNALERYGERFKRKVFTLNEQEYCIGESSFERYAARFAVKEAAFKALGKGWDECGGFTSVEVVNDNNGRPQVKFYGKAFQYTENKNITKVYVSITHDAGISAAIVVLEK